MEARFREKNIPSKKRRKTATSEVSLDETLQSIFEDIDEHLLTIDSDVGGNSYILNENHNIIDSKCDVVQGSIRTSNHFLPEGLDIKSHAQSSKSMKTKQHHKEQVNGNHITLDRKSLEKAIEILSGSSKPKDKKKSKADLMKTKFQRTCHEGYDYMFEMVHWQSYAFMVREIRNLILERDWAHLKEMLRMMLKQPRILKNYIKEITHLYFLISADEMDPVVIENYFTFCFSTFDGAKKPLREFDIWFNHTPE